MERVSRDRLAALAREARTRWRVPGIAVGLMHDGHVTTAADGVSELGTER